MLKRIARPVKGCPNNYLTVTYYDSYDFRSSWIGTYTYLDESLSATANSTTYNQPSTENQIVTGQVTGSKVKVLDGSTVSVATWLKTISYYDDKYRVVQMLSDNYKGGTDRTSNVYDFAGKILKTKSTNTQYDVAWKDATGAAVIGNRLYRTAGSTGWNESGAASVQQLPASTDGWMEVTVSETTSTNRMIGLASSNPDLSYTNMNYAFYLNGSQLRLYESGSSVLIYGTINTGDVLKIDRTGTTVKYYRNGTVIRTSSVASSSALMVDAAIYSTGATLMNVKSSFSASTHTILRRFEYDHAGRLLKTYHKLDSNDEVLLAQNEYNELGQLIDKKLHSVSGSAPKQSIDHRYNIRGWLTSINDAALTLDVSDAKDLFGMNLDYNTTTSGLGNSSMYNGNISGITWSRNLGLADVKQDGYAYSYDVMNRITAAAFKEKSSSWSTPTASAFSESGYTYDLNGNIKSLVRYDKRGLTTVMDNLTYDYGTGTTQSNKLLKVTDSGDDNAGFREFNGSGDDYVYDSNGNLLWDKNKGGEEVLTNGDFTSGSASWTVTDTGSRLTFSGGSVNIASGSAAANILQSGVIRTNYPYVVIIDMERTSGGSLTITAGNASGSASTTGVWSFVLTPSSSSNFYIDIPANFVGKINKVQLKGLVVITYNHLNLVDRVTSASDQQLAYVYDATGRKLNQTLFDVGTSIPVTTKLSSYEGEYFYENDTLKFINTEEGRIVMTGGTPEYQYHLRDHLGNVRITFTTKSETESATGTLETSNLTSEQSKFLRYANARRVQSTIFDHTNGASTGFAQRLSGQGNEVYGIARSLSVMPGDTIRMEVWGKYIDPDTTHHIDPAFTDLVLAIAAGNAPSGTVVDGGSYGSSTTSFGFATQSATNNGASAGSGPKAYLNWLVFDRDYNFIASKSGYARMTTAAREYGQNGSHEKLSGSVTIGEPGYVYIYVSNEEGSNPYEVYFDDMKVEQIKSAVVQMDDYYPFGLTYNSYSRENSTVNQYKYNGKEEQNELDLGWLDYGARMYQPDIGRFMKLDAFAQNYMRHSTYGYVANNPVNNVDFNGDFILPKEFVDKFKRLAQYLKHGVQGILENKRIVNALKKYGGFSDAQLKEAFTWNKGPTVLPTQLGTVKYTDGVESVIDGAYYGGSTVLVDIDLVEGLEKAKGKDRDYMLFMVAVTILHETVHYGNDKNDLPLTSSEEGSDFEKDAYGQKIKMKDDSYKRVLDDWIRRSQTKKGASTSSSSGLGIDFWFLMGSSSGSSGSSSSSGSKTSSIYHPHKFKGKE